jgi:hypothetical protein
MRPKKERTTESKGVSQLQETRKEVNDLVSSAKESVILRALNVPREDVVRLLAEFKSQPEQRSQLIALLKQSARTPDPTNTALVRSYVRLMGSAIGSFHVTPVELGNRISWSPTAKAKLASVMERASDIAMKSKAGTREEAFRKALKEAGLLQKYDEKCRKPFNI